MKPFPLSLSLGRSSSVRYSFIFTNRNKMAEGYKVLTYDDVEKIIIDNMPDIYKRLSRCLRVLIDKKNTSFKTSNS